MKYFWLIIGALFLIYGLLCTQTGSGNGFYLVWLGIAAVFFLFAYLARIHVWSSMPAALRAIFLILAAAGLTFFVLIEVRIAGCFGIKPEKDLDAVIVLGSQVHEDGPSTVLKYRLDKAVEYLNENEDTLCIVSGGQGSNEPFPEALGMKDYLIEQGIPEERIVTETKSLNTKQNIEYSKQFFDPENDRVGLITNNFHIYRARIIARKAGVKNVYGIPADSTLLYLPTNMLREFFAVVSEFKFVMPK